MTFALPVRPSHSEECDGPPSVLDSGLNSGATGDRTPDPFTASEVLSQLSYRPESRPSVADSSQGQALSEGELVARLKRSRSALALTARDVEAALAAFAALCLGGAFAPGFAFGSRCRACLGAELRDTRCYVARLANALSDFLTFPGAPAKRKGDASGCHLRHVAVRVQRIR